MKTEIKNTETKKEFQPFTIEITAETIQDARLLFHLFNAGNLKRIIMEDLAYEFNYNEDFTRELGGYSKFGEIRRLIESQGFEV